MVLRCRTFAKSDLLELGREVDVGFLVSVFVDMIGYLARYCDVDLALGGVEVAALRAFFQQWADELQSDENEPDRRVLVSSDSSFGTMEER